MRQCLSMARVRDELCDLHFGILLCVHHSCYRNTEVRGWSPEIYLSKTCQPEHIGIRILDVAESFSPLDQQVDSERSL